MNLLDHISLQSIGKMNGCNCIIIKELEVQHYIAVFPFLTPFIPTQRLRLGFNRKVHGWANPKAEAMAQPASKQQEPDGCP